MSDLSEQVTSFKRDGSTVMSGVLDRGQVRALRERCRQQWQIGANAQAAGGRVQDFHGEGVRLVYNLHNKGGALRHLMTDSRVLALADVVLRERSFGGVEPYQVALSQARGVVGEQPAQQLHMDSMIPGIGVTMVLQAMWVLDDFVPGAGGTRVVPGSHLRATFAETGVRYDDEVDIHARAGDLVLFDGALWHGASAKTTPGERWIIVYRYSRWFLRPSFDQTRNTSPELYASLTDLERELLGFRFGPPSDESVRVTRISPTFEPPRRTIQAEHS